MKHSFRLVALLLWLFVVGVPSYVTAADCTSVSSVTTFLDGSWNGWTAVNDEGSREWGLHNTYGARINTYYTSNPEYESDFLISPEFDFSGAESVSMTLDHQFYKANDEGLAGYANYAKILVTTNYTGDPTTTSWTELSISKVAAGSYVNATVTGFTSAMFKDKVRIALHLTSDKDNTTS